MLFNSIEFLFVFLPLALVGFYSFGAMSRAWAIRWLILISLVFYAWWRPINVLIIAPSIVVNFILAKILMQLRLDDGQRARRLSKIVLIAGLTFNVVWLGIFKYTDFVLSSINQAFATNMILLHIILPLGISFITFQKIAFLVDVQAGRVRSFTFREYCTFVLFFPQLVAGPIVHYREMMPQFETAACRFEKENVAVGVTLLLFGLFKKAVLADKIAPLITPIYEQAAGGGHTSFALAWMAAVGFTLQIYFDFSGYTDMALGLARFFGIRLPPNFNSPLRASSIIDFWLRWHMTLTRFLTAYIYNPLALWITRRRLAKGRPGFVARNPTVGAFVSSLMVPTVITMFVSGLWHGAGYGFVAWGVLNGIYITINHAWRVVSAKLWPDRLSYNRIMKPAGFVMTFLLVSATMVFFRAPSMISAIDLVKGMMGLNGVALPQGIVAHLGPLAGVFHRIGVVAEVSWNDRDFVNTMMWICVLMVIALACPNTLQLLARHEPALGVNAQSYKPRRGRIALIEWGPSLPWAIAMSAIAAVAIFFIGGPSEFLYWNF
jgi:alginate O-acetyltransferase complex protein AlgI